MYLSCVMVRGRGRIPIKEFYDENRIIEGDEVVVIRAEGAEDLVHEYRNLCISGLCAIA